jgi:hypothetical protein
MNILHVVERTGKDGILHLNLPLGQAETEYEVVVVVQAKQAVEKATTPEERGWPPGYFESTYGSITDESFERPPQGDMPKPVDLE